MDGHLNDEERFRFRETLFGNLRMELDQLKTCQSNSVFWGIAGASAVITIIGAANPVSPESACFFLIPLLIVHPAWMIFFDKYRTIYRLSGFLRLQEKLAIQASEQGLIGWESALEKFWARQGEFQKNPRFIADEDLAIMNVSPIRKRISSHVYMWMVFLVFFLIALPALALCALRISDPVVYLFGATGALYLTWFGFVNYKKKFKPGLEKQEIKKPGERVVLVLFTIYDTAAGTINRVTGFLRGRKTAGPDQGKSGFDNSFRGFLDELTSSQKVYLGVNLVFLSVMSVNFFLFNFQNMSLLITLINVTVFTAFLTFFILVFQITLYILINLI